MKKAAIFLLGILLILTPLTAGAQAEDYSYRPGQMEFTLSGSGSSDEEFDGTVLSVEAGLGYFLTESWEGFIRQGFAFADVPGGSDWAAATRLGVDYNFDFGRFKPLIGATIGYVYGDEINDQFIAGPQIGLKYFANLTTFVYGLVEYEFLFDDADEADDAFDDGRFVYTVGIGFKW